MTKRTGWELVTVIALVILFLAFALPAIRYARAEVRDDVRRTDLSQLKRGLEQYNNKFKGYPAAPAGQANCTGSAEATSWLFGTTSPLLKDHFLQVIPHDVRESADQQYRYCVTDQVNNPATSYFLETRLETPQADIVGFDEDEGRKYNYRILNDHGHILYRVCGGAEQQCGAGNQ